MYFFLQLLVLVIVLVKLIMFMTFLRLSVETAIIIIKGTSVIKPLYGKPSGQLVIKLPVFVGYIPKS